MKRFAPLSAMVVLAMAIVPGAALAQHHERRHHHHNRSHHRHHARHRIQKFGDRGSTPAGPGQQGQGTAPAAAGTIKSFDNGTLTIMLADGSLVSGQVTNRTEIECRMAGAENGNGDNDMRADDGGPGNNDNGGSGDNGNGNGNGNGNDGNENHDMCSATALTAGASVQDAVLSLSSLGATWTRVDLTSS